jgi:hypothetical protein
LCITLAANDPQLYDIFEKLERDRNGKSLPRGPSGVSTGVRLLVDKLRGRR